VEHPGPDADLVAPFARLTQDRIREIAREVYGLEVIAISRLDTERDDSYALETAEGMRLIKVANPVDDPSVIDLSVQAMRHAFAQDATLPIPQVLPAIDGALVTEVAGSLGEPRLSRLLTWLPGRVATNYRGSPKQSFARGHVLGRLSLALSAFEHPGAQRVLAWDVQQLSSLRSLLSFVGDADIRDIIESHLDLFDAQIGPALAGSRQQVIHNDLNSENVLIDEADADVVAGVLDFGDIVYSAIVVDAGLAMSYVIETSGTASDAWYRPYQLAAGFTSVRPLTSDEQELLPDVVRSRLTQRILVGSWLSATNPVNAEYTSRTIESATAALRLLHNTNPSTVRL